MDKKEFIEKWLVELYNTYHGLVHPGTVILVKHSSEMPRQEMMTWLLVIMRMTNNFSDIAKEIKAGNKQDAEKKAKEEQTERPV